MNLVCIIPHQANIRIIEALASRLELSMDRLFREHSEVWEYVGGFHSARIG